METPEQPPEEKRRLNAWPLLFCVFPVVIAFVLIALINRPASNTVHETRTNAPSAADLGSRGLPLAAANHDKTPAVETENGPPSNSTPKGEQDSPPAPGVSEREIEIHIKNLKFAVQHNNVRGANLESAWLKEASPRPLVISCLTTASDAESDSMVRLAYFQCLEEPVAAMEWATRAYAKWTGRFLGTDLQLEPGNIAEFSAYARVLFDRAPLEGEGLALAKNALTTAQPEWLMPVLSHSLAYTGPAETRVKPILPELTGLLETGATKGQVRDELFVAWSNCFGSIDELLIATQDARMQLCLVALLKEAAASRNWRGPELERVIVRVGEILASTQATEIKREFIAALSSLLPLNKQEVGALIEAGMARRDANLADYLEAFGKLASTAQELKRLVEFANETNANTARGAINGLRQSPLKAADDELRTILSVGQNSGVKSDALAALLERNPQTRDLLVDEYLAEDKPASLRVISVAYLSDKRLDKLKDLGENDPEMRVREAAINKLGSLKDKSLKTWFTRVSRSDSVPVLRQLARKYAAELE